MRHFLSSTTLFAIFCAVFLAACASRSPSPFANLSSQQARALAEKLAQQRDAELQADLRDAFAHHAPQNILILSGGDANGAFGCGILKGWRDAPAGRPTFDIVTGVSTGALIAAFAFLGDELDDTTLRDVYTNIQDKDIFDGPINFSPPNSVFDTGPLKQLIAAHVTPDALRRIAAAHREGRRLYVTTVELDSGAVYIWPVSKIASDAIYQNSDPSGMRVLDTVDPAAVERIRAILLAAAAIPVFFPPVEIDGGLHADAGLGEAITLRQFMLCLRRVGDPASSDASTGERSSATVWAILNGKLRSAPHPVDNSLLGIGMRSLDIYNDSMVILSLRDTALVAATHNPPFQFRWLSEPDDLDAGPGPGLFHPMFDPAITRQLYATGKTLGQAGLSQWHQGPPPLDADPMVSSNK